MVKVWIEVFLFFGEINSKLKDVDVVLECVISKY